MSGRKNRTNTRTNDTKPTKISNKNLIQCRVILLDGTDLSVELSVSPFPGPVGDAPNFNNTGKCD